MSARNRSDGEYDDIISLPHHMSLKHPRLPMANRAAQFAPFAALTGFDGVIAETGRLTDRFIPLDEDQKEAIDLRLDILKDRIREKPEAAFTYFVRDEKKEGGSYRSASGAVKRIDDVERRIILTDGTKIDIDSLYSVSGDLFSEYFPY